MSFASSGAFWLALTLPLIVLMYLLKKQYTDKTVSSHLLWKRVLQQTEARRPWQSLRSRLLMLLQMLIAFLLVMALAGPFATGEVERHDHLVFVLDRSASMQALERDGMTRFDKAVNAIRERIGASGADRFTLMVTGDRPEIVLFGSASKEKFLAALRQVRPYYGVSAYADAWANALALVEAEETARLIIVTDGNWTDAERMRKVASVDAIEWVDVRSESVDNISIVRFGVVPGVESRFVQASAVIRNGGTRDRNVSVAVDLDDTEIAVHTEHLLSGESRSLFFNQLPSGEVYRLRLVEDDPFPADNTAHALAGDGNRSPIALVSGDPGLFWLTALKVAGVQIVHTELGQDHTYAIPDTEFDIVVLDRWQADRYNTPDWEQVLQAKPVWMLEWTDEETAMLQVREPVQLSDHPLTRMISLDETYVARAAGVDRLPWAGLDAVVHSGDTGLIYAGMVAGAPKLVHTFALTDSDFPLRPQFPVYVGNAIEWLAGGGTSELGSAVAGSVIELDRAREAAQARWRLLEPYAPGLAAAEWDAAPGSHQSVPDVPGLYAFTEMNPDGEVVRERRLHVYADPAESMLNREPVWQRLADHDRNTDDGPPYAGASTALAMAETGRSLVPWVIMITLILLVAEWEVYQRGRSL